MMTALYTFSGLLLLLVFEPLENIKDVSKISCENRDWNDHHPR